MTEAPFAEFDTSGLPATARLVRIEAVASTNDLARDLVRDGAEDGTVVWARQQSSGRGRQGREWTSPPGNLYTTTILKPGCEIARWPEVSFMAALAVAEAVSGLVPGVNVQLKWPNDVLVDDAKVSGILLETVPDAGAILIGTGLNVASHPDNTPYPATHLAALAELTPGEAPSVGDALEAYLGRLWAWRARWDKVGFNPIREGWRYRARGLGEAIAVDLGEERIEGRFDDLDATGALIVALDGGGQRVISAGDVIFREG